jgi:hypothetical protein
MFLPFPGIGKFFGIPNCPAAWSEVAKIWKVRIIERTLEVA